MRSNYDGYRVYGSFDLKKPNETPPYDKSNIYILYVRCVRINENGHRYIRNVKNTHGYISPS